MTWNKEGEALHIAMFPWFGLSHLTSSLRLANKLAERGHKVSYFLPPKAQPKLAPHNHRPNLITFIPVPVPSVDGLPPGCETIADTPFSAWPNLITAIDLTRPTIDSHLTQLKPDFIMYGFICSWIPDLAREHRAKSLYYGNSNLARFAYLLPWARGLPANHCYSEEELMNPPPGFPTLGAGMRMRAYEARPYTERGMFLLEMMATASQKM